MIITGADAERHRQTGSKSEQGFHDAKFSSGFFVLEKRRAKWTRFFRLSRETQP